MANAAGASDDEINTGPMGTGPYTVQAGECIFSIAYEHGVLWDTLWNFPANAQLRGARKDPGVLLPGDQITIPDREMQVASGGTAARHSFKIVDQRVKLRLLIEFEDMPVANAAYTLVLDSTTCKGTTDGNGLLEESISPLDKQGRLEVNGVCFTLQLGRLDPASEDVGIQQRLANLDFYRGALDGDIGPVTREAIADFQARTGVDVTGELDSDTRRKLLHRHDASHEQLQSKPVQQGNSAPADHPDDADDSNDADGQEDAGARHIGRLQQGSTGVVTLNTRDSNFVYLRLEWPVDIADRLPEDFALTLSGPEILEQSKTSADASQEDERLQFEFEWRDKTKSVKLTATGGGKTVELWQEQVAGDLTALIDWNERIHPLLSEPEDVYLPTNDTSAGSIPDDLHDAETRTLGRACLESVA